MRFREPIREARSRERTTRCDSVELLVDRFPRLRLALPRVALLGAETPVERCLVGGATLLVKRDDLTSPTLGGNKVRSLELLLAAASPDRRLLTVGPRGSTHALAVALHGARLGRETEVLTWPQEMHDVAVHTSRRLKALARVTEARSPSDAYLRAALRRVRGQVQWIPAGGSSPLGVLGHAGAALELVAQLARDGVRMPEAVVVPLGSGGTVAGLLLGFAIAGMTTRVIGVRVVPRIVGNRGHVLRLAHGSHALLGRLAGEAVPRIDHSRLVIEHASYGGAYGRATAAATGAAELFGQAGGPRLDGTYSAKAFGHALALAQRAPSGAVLFWLTFDARWLDAVDDTLRGLRPPR